MALVLLIIGVVMIVAAVRNTVTTNGSTEGLGELIAGDFSGPNNFIFWLVAILVIGAIGYVPTLRNLSNAILALIIVALFLTKGQGFFSQAQTALASTTQGAPSPGSSIGSVSAGNLLQTQLPNLTQLIQG